MATASFVVGTLVSLGATAFGIGSSIATANAQAKQAQINAEYQRKEAERQAEIVEQNAQIEEAEARRKSRRNLASMEAQYASSGVTMAGSPSEFLAEQAMYDEYNIELANLNTKEKINTLIRQGNNAVILGESTASSYKASALNNSIASGLNWGTTTSFNSANFFKETTYSKVGQKFNNNAIAQGV